ncbi:MAG: hypothetical protein ACEPO2_20430 [Pelagibaca sp.]
MTQTGKRRPSEGNPDDQGKNESLFYTAANGKKRHDRNQANDRGDSVKQSFSRDITPFFWYFHRVFQGNLYQPQPCQI